MSIDHALRRTVFSGAVLLLGSLWPLAAGGASEEGTQAVRIRQVAAADYVSLFVENGRAHDVTVALTIRASNVGIEWLAPEVETYDGHSQTEAVRLYRRDPRKRWDYRYRFDWIKGSLHAEHGDDVLYELPYEPGTSHKVSQGYNGKLTHQGQEQYAVDFAMEEGTAVCAARAGVVVDVKESSKTGGPRRKYKDDSNYVSIAHTDGTIGEYHHLQYNRVLVEVGQRVDVGTIIALSGNTGYSTCPHLHFGVYSAVDATTLKSHRVTFSARQGTVAEPVEGRTYTAK
jgi:murein DD-endopeptidase MepM/ murein hydrolase activator NlpD